MGNKGIEVTPQTDGVTVKVGCKNVRFTHAIGLRNQRVNTPMTAQKKAVWDAAKTKYKVAATKWAADGANGTPPAKPRKPPQRYTYVERMGFEIKMKSGYDQAYIKSDDLLALADAFLGYYEEVVGYEKLANTTLDTMEKAYAADKKAKKKGIRKPTVADVRGRILQAEATNAAG